MTGELKFFIVLILLFVSFFLPLDAQEVRKDFIDINGIDSPTFFHTDENGFIWISATNGLFRYDGNTFTKVLIKDLNNEIVHSQNIQSPIVEDGEGVFWFSTYEAMHSFDPRTEMFRTYVTQIDDEIINEEYRVFYHFQAKNEIWLAAGWRLWAFDIESKLFRDLGHSVVSYNYEVKKTEYGQIIVVGCPWFDGTGLEVFNYDIAKDQFTKTVFDNSATFNKSVQDKRGGFYLASDEGLYKLENSELNYDLVKIKADSLPDKYLLGLDLYQSQNKIIANYPGKGLYLYNIESRLAQKIASSNSNTIALWLDNKERSWLVDMVEGIRIITPRIGDKAQLLFDDKITTAVQNKDGELYGIDVDGDLHLIFSSGRNPVSNLDYFFNFHRLSAGLDNELYLSGNRKLIRYDPKTKRSWMQPTNQDYGGRVICFSDRRCLTIQSRRLTWLDFNGDSLVLSGNPLNLDSTERPELYEIFDLDEDRFALPYKITQLKIFQYHAGRLVQIDSIDVGAQTFDVLWSERQLGYYIATNAGLFFYSNNELQKISTKSIGIDQLEAYSLFEDSSGRIWMGTYQGLFCLDHGKFSVFTTSSGLPNDQFIETPSIDLGNDSFIMLSEAGPLLLHAQSLQADTASARPYLMDLWINNQSYQGEIRPFALERLERSFKENTITLKVGVISTNYIGKPFKVEYQLLGYEEDATVQEAGKEVKYTKLQAGKYTFKVSSINHNGLKVGTWELPIVIRPPFHQTALFWVLISLGVVLLATGIHLWLLRREVLKQTRLREAQTRITQERDRIAGEVHDDLGGQLSSILFLSESLMFDAEEDAENRKEISRIHALSKSSLQNVRDIIFALDNRRATLSDLLNKLERNGREYFQDLGIQFNFRNNLPEVDFELSSKQKRHTILIIKEAFHNVFKHADANWVLLSVEFDEDKRVVLTVDDDGKGFDLNENEKSLGFGLENMEKKASDAGFEFKLTSRHDEGTKVQLVILPTAKH